MPPFHHAVLRARPGAPSLIDARAPSLWRDLRGAFPDALAVVLMPDHAHIVAPGAATDIHVRLRTVAGRQTRRAQASRGDLWKPLTGPQPIADRQKLLRAIRYVALNPCRARLCDDPIAWTWTSYRDVLGAVIDPWVTRERLTPFVGGWSRAGLHRYISADPSTRVDGTAIPAPAPSTDVPRVFLERIVRATATAGRTSTEEVFASARLRRAFVHAARHQGWRRTAWLATTMSVTPRAVQRIVARDDADARDVRAVLLTLAIREVAIGDRAAR